MTKVLIIGGRGMVGQYLGKQLLERKYEVSVLSRSKNTGIVVPAYAYDIAKDEIDIQALAEADYIINLAGANVGEKRWSKKQKQIIYDSRVKQSDFIFQKMAENKLKPKAYLSASAIGYYGLQSSDTIFSETDKAGNDFLAGVCKDWEEKALQFQSSGIRTVIFRIGLVLSNEGGALEPMALPARLGLLSPLGNGKQCIPWIHIQDLCRLFIHAIENNAMKGIYNAVSPQHITNKEFTRTLLNTFNRRMLFPKVPAFFLKIALGERALLLLKGSRVSAQKIMDSGFKFTFEKLDQALYKLLK